MKPTDETPVINFNSLKDALLSTDLENAQKAYDVMVSKDPKFLDTKVDMMGNRVVLASFPRSGNSFLRKIIEQITGVFSGSDFHMKDCLPLQ
jgi:hypothetical protein